MHPPESNYRRDEDGAWLVEIRLRETRQLFNSLDPAPFHEKDLDDEAERYIVGAVRDFHLDAPLKLVFHLPAGATGAETIPDAVHHYFAYRGAMSARELRSRLRQGRISLLIGLAFLFTCITLRQTLLLEAHDSVLAEIVAEGLLISGWVAMWEPIQIFLYDWWPIRAMRRIYDKIAVMPIEVRTGE